jgi:hypothetical protein
MKPKAKIARLVHYLNRAASIPIQKPSQSLPVAREGPTKKLLLLGHHRDVPFKPVKIHSHKNGLAFLSIPPVLFHMSLLT